MESRAWFWRFWRITPAEYRELTQGEYEAMVSVMKEVARQNRKAKARR